MHFSKFVLGNGPHRPPNTRIRTWCFARFPYITDDEQSLAHQTLVSQTRRGASTDRWEHTVVCNELEFRWKRVFL